MFIIQPTEEMNCFSDLSAIHDCSFVDHVYLGVQHGIVSFQNNLSLPAGISHTTLRNCYLFPGICVMQNTLIENTVILQGSIVMGCGRITCRSNSFVVRFIHREWYIWEWYNHQHG